MYNISIMIITIAKNLAYAYIIVFVIVCILHLVLVIPLVMMSGGRRMDEDEELPLEMQGPFAITNYVFMHPMEMGGYLYKFISYMVGSKEIGETKNWIKYLIPYSYSGKGIVNFLFKKSFSRCWSDVSSIVSGEFW